jgi:hypothetical protein
MTINSNKFLPQGKTNNGSIVKYKAESYLIPFKNIIDSKGLKDKQKENFDSNGEQVRKSKDIVKIKNLVLEIESILKKNLKSQKKQYKNKSKLLEKERFTKREKDIENKSEKEFQSPKIGISMPRLGIFDWIKRFLFWTILGRIISSLSDHFPTLIKISEKIIPVVGFLGKLTGDFLNGLVDFIDFGYSAYDKVRDLSKWIGGESFQKVFDDFSNNLNTFVNLAIVAGLASIGGPGGGRGRVGGGGGRPGRGGGKRGLDGDFKKGKFTGYVRGFGISDTAGQGFNLWKQRGTLKGGFEKSQNDIMKRYFQKYGRDAFVQRFGQEGLERLPGGLARSGLTKAARGAFVGLAGKGGAKLILGTVRPLLKRLPIIGALIDFGLSVALGEPLGRAAFKSIGAFILGSIGTGFGGPLGAIVGGFAGDWAGGKLYDIFFGGQKNVDDNTKIKKKATGGSVTGNVTRNGKIIGGSIKRGIKKVGSIKATPSLRKLSPGSAIGGEDKVQKIFPKPPEEDIGKVVNPYGVLTNISDEMIKIAFFGPLFAIFAKTILGDKITKLDYKNVGLGINAWINNAIVKGYLEGGLNLVQGFSNGGIIRKEIVDDDMTKNISRWVEKSVEELVKNKVTAALNEFRKNLGLKPLTSAGDEIDPDELGEGGSVRVSSDSPDFWLLATAAMFENSNPQGAADVAQVIYNRTQYPAWDAPTIKQAILNPGQFQPVRKYGGTASWAAIKTKEDALRFSRSHGKTQEQLERVAAALLDKERQRSAREFVGPRDSFRAEGYEKEVDHLDNETEKTRHGHTFGFEPRGATIGAFKAGKLSAAQVNESVVTGSVMEQQIPSSGWKPRTPGKFNAIQYITGDRSHPNYRADHGGGNYHEHVAFKTSEEKEKAKRALIASGFVTGSEYRPGDPGYHGRGLALDVPFYGQRRRYSDDKAGEEKFSADFRSVLGLKGGGLVGPKSPNVNPSSLYSYDDEAEVIMMIQPIIIETNAEFNNKSNNTVPGFGQVSRSLNSYNSSMSQLMAR